MARRLDRIVHHRWFVPICFLIFLTLRAGLIAFVPVEQASDNSWYIARAEDIVRGHGFSEDGVPTAYWPVGWPAVIALLYRIFGIDVNVVLIANLLFAAGTFFVMLGLGRQLFGFEAAARISVFLLAVYPNNIAYTSLTSTEVFYTFLLLLGTWLFIARRTMPAAILCGLIFGYATLTKPQTLLMPAALVGISFLFENGHRLKMRTLAHGAMVYLCLAMVLGPWIYRNYLVFGEPVFVSTNSGWALYVGNNPSSLARRGFPTDSGAEVTELRRKTFTLATQVESNRQARAAALAWISENPGTFLLLMPIKAFSLWAVDGEAEWLYQLGSPSYDKSVTAFRTIRILNQGYYLLLISGFAVAGWMILRRYLARDRQAAIPVWSLTGYVFAAYTTFQCMVMAASYRYKFPLMPFVVLSSAWVISCWLASHRQNRRGDEHEG